jgi:hypothetical protein
MGINHEGVWSLAILLLIFLSLEMTGCTHVYHSSEPTWEYPHE